mgnify:CR=1 FL=1
MGRRYVKCEICRERLSDLISIGEEIRQVEAANIWNNPELDGKNVCTICILAQECKIKWEAEDELKKNTRLKI